MSMEHKAFLFDTRRFDREIAPILRACGPRDDPEPLKAFIRSHLAEMRALDSLDPLPSEWEKQLRAGDVQEAADLAMTCCYSLEEDIGLGYSWDALLETLRGLKLRKVDAERVVLGRPFRAGRFVLDPGRMGMGFVRAEEVPSVHRLLDGLGPSVRLAKLPPAKDLLYELSKEEVLDAYDNLVALYRHADEAETGLMMTF